MARVILSLMETELQLWQAQFTSLPIETMRTIERAAFAAWPAPNRLDVDGWRARGAQGVTGRANSVWSLEHCGTLGLDEKLAAVEDFYAAQSLPPRFQIHAAVQPESLDDLLTERGYMLDSPTHVQTAPLAAILERTPPLRATPHLEIVVAEEFDDEWFALYAANEAMDARTTAVREQILRAIKGPVAFTQLGIDGAPATAGLGVIDGPWLGIFCMTTHPTQRRRGAALGLLRAMAIWGALYEATDAYLQVSHGNDAALATYARAGFSTAYTYHYRVKK